MYIGNPNQNDHTHAFTPPPTGNFWVVDLHSSRVYTAVGFGFLYDYLGSSKNYEHLNMPL